MKLIQAMKQVKDLQKKADDLKAKVSNYCVDMDFETPVYGSEAKQRDQIKEWLQAYHDILKEILSLRIAIQKTNLSVSVTIELDGKQVTKSIAEWIHRRRDLAGMEFELWKSLTDKNLKEGQVKTSTGEIITAKIRRYYDPAEKDKWMALFQFEPSIIDANLEIINAITDCQE